METPATTTGRCARWTNRLPAVGRRPNRVLQPGLPRRAGPGHRQAGRLQRGAPLPALGVEAGALRRDPEVDLDGGREGDRHPARDQRRGPRRRLGLPRDAHEGPRGEPDRDPGAARRRAVPPRDRRLRSDRGHADAARHRGDAPGQRPRAAGRGGSGDGGRWPWPGSRRWSPRPTSRPTPSSRAARRRATPGRRSCRDVLLHGLEAR